MKKIRYILPLLCLGILLFASTCFADTLSAKPEFTYDGKSLADYAGLTNQPVIVGQSAYAMNLNTGTLVFEKNSTEIVYPASTTKLMTAIVAYENIMQNEKTLDFDITASAEAVRKTQGANVRIEEGEVYSARELLNSLLIAGANDAALVLAEHVAGSEAEFCILMNQKAKELGAVNTTYGNVTGFHNEASVTTARDTALIAQYFYYIPDLFEMSDTTRYADSDRLKRILVNRNLLLSRATVDDYYYSTASGMSMGSTPEGGHCIVSTVTSDDNQIYLCVVMNSKEERDINYAYKDIISIFEFCIENFSYQSVLSAANVVCEIPVNNAVDVDHVALFPDRDVKMLLPNDLDIKDISLEKRVEVEETDAPVNRGDAFGEVVVKYKDEIAVGRAKLVSDVTIDKSNVLYFFSRTKSILFDSWFSKFLIAAGVLFAIYFGMSVYFKYFKKNKYTGNRPRRR